MFWRKLQRLAFILFILTILLSIFLYIFLKDKISLENFQKEMLSFGFWAPSIFVAFYTFITIFVPSTPFMALAGILFGFKYGLIYTVIGGLLSSVLVFGVARKLGQEQVERVLENKYLKYVNKYNKRLGSGGLFDLLILRIMPIMPFNALNILMGLSKIKTSTYLFGTLFGLAPSNILAVYFGDIISKIF